MKENLQNIFDKHHENITQEKIASEIIQFLQLQNDIRDFYVTCDNPYDNLIIGLLLPKKKKFTEIKINK